MKNFTCNIDNQEYQVIQHSTEPMTFRILHASGFHQICRKYKGEYVYMVHGDFTEAISLKKIGEEIEKHL